MSSSSNSRVWIEAASRGDGEAVEALLARHLPGVETYLRLRAGRIIQAKESISDLTQSVCREILEDLGSYQFETESRFRHWLYTTADRKVQDRGRHWARAKRDARREAPLHRDSGSHDSYMVGIVAAGASPSQDAAAREELERLEQAFAKLPEEHREVILQAKVTGLSRAEIARNLDKSEGAVRTLLSRALARLSVLLDGSGAESGGTAEKA